MYYSGHANGSALELGSTTFSFAELRNFLKQSSADVRLAVLDSCQSGSLIVSKGGHRVTNVHITSLQELNSKGHVIITSSGYDELSQESEEIRGAFFSHYLVSGLRGAADASGDREVTLAEAYDYAYQQTVAHTSLTLSGAQHPMFDLQLSGHGRVVLTRLPEPRPLIYAQLPTGRLLVLDAARQNSLLELSLDAPHQRAFSLKPGTYEVFWLQGDRALHTQLRARSGSTAVLRSPNFKRIDLEMGVAKGGLFLPQPDDTRTHELRIALLGKSWALSSDQLAFGGALEHRLQLTHRLQSRLVIYGSTHKVCRDISAPRNCGCVSQPVANVAF